MECGWQQENARQTTKILSICRKRNKNKIKWTKAFVHLHFVARLLLSTSEQMQSKEPTLRNTHKKPDIFLLLKMFLHHDTYRFRHVPIARYMRDSTVYTAKWTRSRKQFVTNEKFVHSMRNNGLFISSPEQTKVCSTALTIMATATVAANPLASLFI